MSVDESWCDEFAFCIYFLIASSILSFQFVGFSDFDYCVFFHGDCALTNYLFVVHCDYGSAVDEEVHVWALLALL